MARTELQGLTMETYLTSHEAAGLIQANPSSINKWVKEKKINCYRTPGGHRRIQVAEFISFLQRYQMPVPAKLKACTQPVVTPQKKPLIVMVQKRSAKKR